MIRSSSPSPFTSPAPERNLPERSPFETPLNWAPASEPPDDLDDPEALQRFLGVRYLLLATIFGIRPLGGAEVFPFG